MTLLLIYIAVTVAGYFIGTALKKHGKELNWVGKLQTLVIIVLVFLMGSRIGANEEIVSSLGTIGLVSFIFTLIVLLFTIVFATIARRLLGFDRYGRRAADVAAGVGAVGEAEAARAGETVAAGAAVAGEAPAADKGASRVNTLTLLIVGFIAIGIAAGYWILPAGFIAVTGTLLTLSLCLLLILIGIDIGTEGTLAANFKSAGWRVFVFPFVTIIAMVVGSIVAALFLPMSMQDGLCIGSGFAWYSLAPVMLAEYSTRVSAISFMHNVFRELMGILLVPLCAKHVGYLESYSLPGATAMDVCLPIVERSTNSDVAVYSFISGAVVSASVPVLVSIFMSI